jgi:hypothetical protein
LLVLVRASSRRLRKRARHAVPLLENALKRDASGDGFRIAFAQIVKPCVKQRSRVDCVEVRIAGEKICSMIVNTIDRLSGLNDP